MEKEEKNKGKETDNQEQPETGKQETGETTPEDIQIEDSQASEISSEEDTSELQEAADQDENLEFQTGEDQENDDNHEKGDEKKKSEEEASVKKSPEFKALNEKYLRLYAEFDNFRKRTAKETLELIQTANCDLLTKLLPTLENFEIAFAPGQKAKKLEDFEKGIKMIFNSFKDVLEGAGLEEINPLGEEFDPQFHEAMLEQPHNTVEEGHIAEVYQKGYKVKSKILKHAKVIISKGKE